MQSVASKVRGKRFADQNRTDKPNNAPC
jgi:hypothetical protein